MRSKTKKKFKPRRNFSFVGNCYSDSILIGNYGNAKFSACGHFNLSGILFCLDGRVEFKINGSGHITLLGKCKELVILDADGDCIIDFSELRCETVICKSVKGLVTIQLGEVKRVEVLHMNEEATLKIFGNPLVTAHTLDDHARILCSNLSLPPMVIHP